MENDMSKMSELDHNRDIAIGEMAVSLVRYINYEMVMGWEHMHYDDRLAAIIKWFTHDGDDDQVMCPHDWVGEALHRRIECAMLIAKLPGPEWPMVTVKPFKSPYMHDGMVKVTDIGKHQAYISGAAQRWSDGLDKIITPVIAPERGDEAELRILDLENQLDLARGAGKRLQDERNKLAAECASMHQNFRAQGEETIQLRDTVDSLSATLSIRDSMLELVEARVNKYVAAEKKAKRERGNA
jgi:hypothetical protein